MSSLNDKEIDKMFQAWYEVKKQIAELEKENEKYKKMAEKILKLEGTSKYTSNHFNLSRRVMKRNTIVKSDVPANIWQEYSKEVSYPGFFLTKKKKST
jgi:hypothetical protein